MNDVDRLYHKIKTHYNHRRTLMNVSAEELKFLVSLLDMMEDDDFAKDINVPGKWISVTDRLPTSVANKVLVWLEHEDLNGYLGFGHYEKYKGQEIWYDLEHNEAFSIRGYAVTHWMPLPTPPGGES